MVKNITNNFKQVDPGWINLYMKWSETLINCRHHILHNQGKINSQFTNGKHPIKFSEN